MDDKRLKWLNRVTNVSVDTLISASIMFLVGAFLASFAEGMDWRLIGLCTVIAAIPILAIRLEKRVKTWLRAKQREEFFLGLLSTIPDEKADDTVWSSWVLQARALLWGARRLTRKSDILSSLIGQADPPARPEIAKNFIRGAAQASVENSKAV